MRNYFFIILALSTLSSCVEKSKFEQLQSENQTVIKRFDSILTEHNNLKLENKQLNNEIENFRKIAKKKKERKNYNNDDAIRLLKDYYSFYAKEKMYKNLQVRKVNNNTFHLSMDEKNKGENWLWYSQIKTLTINEDGTYRVK